MKHLAFHDSRGNVVRTMSVSNDVVLPPMDGLTAVELPEMANAVDLYFSGGTIKKKPPQPGEPYDFDPATGKWVLSTGRAWELVRQERNRRITASDWSTLPDVPMTPERRAQWAAYRQALRDITSQPDPTKITWPVAPS